MKTICSIVCSVVIFLGATMGGYAQEQDMEQESIYGYGNIVEFDGNEVSVEEYDEINGGYMLQSYLVSELAKDSFKMLDVGALVEFEYEEKENGNMITAVFVSEDNNEGDE